MKVTVITVCFNSQETIRDTIASVLFQDYPNVEYVIVDGGSTDSTLDIIYSYGDKIDKIISGKDSGIYDAMNKGLSVATGDVVGFINSDDIYASSDVLSVVSNAFLGGGVDACYGDLVYTERTDMSKIVRKWRSGPFSKKLYAIGWSPAHPTFFARKSCFDNSGVFDLSYKLAADYDLMLRFLWVSEYSSVYINRTLVKMRMGGVTNASYASVVKQNLEILRCLKSHGVDFSFLLFIKKPFEKIRQYFN